MAVSALVSQAMSVHNLALPLPLVLHLWHMDCVLPTLLSHTQCDSPTPSEKQAGLPLFQAAPIRATCSHSNVIQEGSRRPVCCCPEGAMAGESKVKSWPQTNMFFFSGLGPNSQGRAKSVQVWKAKGWGYQPRAHSHGARGRRVCEGSLDIFPITHLGLRCQTRVV